MNQKKILDIQDDRGALLSRIIQGASGDVKGSFEKVAQQIPTQREHEYIYWPDRDFALIYISKEGERTRHYPIKHIEDTWASAIYMPHTFAHLPKMAAATAAVNLARQAKAFGLEIDPSLEKFASNFPRLQGNLFIEAPEAQEDGSPVPFSTRSLEKVARDVKQQDMRYWGLSVNGKAKYPLFDEHQVKTAAAYFQQYHRALAPAERNEFAKRIVARAIEYDAVETLDRYPTMKKYASANVGPNFEREVDQRLSILTEKKSPALHLAEREYAFLKEASQQWRPNQVAQGLEHLDQKYGLLQYWDKAIDDPYAATYGGNLEKNASVTFDDMEITDDLLKRVPEEKFKSTFGNAMWDAFVKDRVMIFDHLPKPEKEALLNMAGVSSEA